MKTRPQIRIEYFFLGTRHYFVWQVNIYKRHCVNKIIGKIIMNVGACANLPSLASTIACAKPLIKREGIMLMIHHNLTEKLIRVQKDSGLESLQKLNSCMLY